MDGRICAVGRHTHPDGRYVAMPGRISPPDAIFGSVAFTDAKLAPETYERNDTYRFAAKHEGPMKLPERWMKQVRAHIEQHE